MEDDDSIPVLLCVKSLKPEYNHLQKIALTSEQFTIGRGLKNSVIIPFVAISRNHCIFKRIESNEWAIEDTSSFGIRINDEKIRKGTSMKLSHQDVISLEPTDEFVYKFIHPSSDVFEIPRKRMKMENNGDKCILNNVKMKFEESQNYELKHIEDKIQSAKQLQNTTIILKQQLQLDMDRKIQQLESNFAQQIENLKGERNEVEKQKASLIEERDAQLAQVKNEMEGKIAELMEQIQKHNETESELLNENNLLKEKLTKEREEFLSELSRESSSKQDMLDKLKAKIREQEEVRLKEKKELEEILKRETEQLTLAKEKELKELEEQKQIRELELEQELNDIKRILTEQVEQTKQQQLKAEEQLSFQMEQMKKLSDKEKIEKEQLQKESEEMKNKLTEAQQHAEKSLEELRKRVMDRETELAVLAAERIEQQQVQSSEVITTLQEQLEKMKSQLQSVEMEKNSLLESICSEGAGEGTSKQSALTEVGELMESELQCSICAELFIEATTLNCSHTFCKYCITMWKKKKKDCPICRSGITSENRSLVLDSFIDKMVQNLTEEMRIKRQEILKFRAEEVSTLTNPSSRTATSTSSSRRRRRTNIQTTSITVTTAAATTTRTMTTRTRTTRPIPVVDLTVAPTPSSPAERPPVLPLATRLQALLAQGRPQLMRLYSRLTPQQRGRLQVPEALFRPVEDPLLAPALAQEMVTQLQLIRALCPRTTSRGQVRGVGGDGAGGSQESPAPTMEGTGAATAAAHAGTGPPAAHSGSMPAPLAALSDSMPGPPVAHFGSMPRPFILNENHLPITMPPRPNREGN